MTNTAKDKATARPWKIDEVKSDKTLVYCRIAGTNVYKTTVAGTDKANASLIVKCCNGWDSVIALLHNIQKEGLTSDNQKRIEEVLEADKN
jgi:hypothetical protein